MTLTRFAVVAALLGVACGEGPEFSGVRDVRPGILEHGDTLVVELAPDVRLAADATTEVVISGEVDRPDADELDELTVTFQARVNGRNRVLVDVDDRFAEEVGGRGRGEFAIAVRQNGEIVATTGDDRLYELDMFPSTVRKIAHRLVGETYDEAFLDWLGVELELTEDGTGLVVASARGGFMGTTFLQTYDCGRWIEADKRCVGGPDFKVHRDEAKSLGFTDEAVFDWIDLDGNGVTDRYEIVDFLHEQGVDAHESSSLPPSPAVRGGIKEGDVIVKADGKATPSVRALARAWKEGEGDSVALTVMRDGNPVELTLGRYGEPPSVPRGFLLAGILVVVGLLVILPVPLLGGFIVVWERKISGYIQSRPGPNRVGPNGWLQWLADGVKLIVKEDIIPTAADPILFRVSPFLVFTGVFATFVVLPFSPVVQVANLDVGILYILSVTSIVVVGVIMGGWASNSKWSLLGGMRSAAQIISYELPASIAVLTVVTLVGSLSTQDIVLAQGGLPHEWFLFKNPFTFVCFFIFFISALAEGNRTPFDLPEAESELVSGYNTEYSGFRFSIFALAEWVNLVVIGAVTSTLFLGGWQIPGVDPIAIESSLFLQVLAFVVMAGKITFFIFVCIWIRWTLPRFRIDHMMSMCWKYFMPISLVSLLGVAAWTWLLPDVVEYWIGVPIALLAGGGLLLAFFQQVARVRKTTHVHDLRGA